MITNQMPNLLVTGASGQLGSEFRFLADEAPYHFVFSSREDMDLSNLEEVQKFLQKTESLDAIIHCAAYTAVDNAEEDHETCELVNVKASEILAKYCEEHSIPLLSYSSDYVYHNGSDRPLKETDVTTPQGVYAKTKLRGEQVIAKYCQRHFIFRTSWVYSSYGHNFVKTMIRLMGERDELRIINDQIGAPTYAADLARWTLDMLPALLDDNLGVSPGVYNLSNAGQTSWYHFAKAIRDLLDLQCDLEAIPTTEYPTPARRPKYSVMSHEKILSQFPELNIPSWEESLVRCLQRLGHQV